MNSLQILFLSINLFLIIGLSSLQRVTNKFCRNGQLDTAVRVNNGRIFIFFDSYLTEITESLEVVRNTDPIPIRKYFSGLNFDRIVASFTADGHNNPNRGKTYFIRRKQIKEYSGLAPTGLHANMSHWIGMWKMKRVNLVVNQIGDSNAIFFDIKSNFTTEDQNNNKRFEMYFFDNVTEPSQISINKYIVSPALIEYPLKNKQLMIKAVISLSKNYLLFYNPIDRRRNGKYCFAKNLREGCKVFLESKSFCNSITNGTNQSTTPIPSSSRPITPAPRPTTTTRRRRPPPTTTITTTTPSTTTQTTTTPSTTTSTTTTKRRTTTRRKRRTKRRTKRTTPMTTTTETPTEGNSDDSDNSYNSQTNAWLLIVFIVLIVLAVIASIFWIFFIIYSIRNDKLNEA